MLPLKNRLKKREDFKEVYQKGKFLKDATISLKYSKNNLDFSRIGFSIESKYFKTAVERNRVKRILREIFKEKLQNLKPGFDIVVFRKKPGKIEFSGASQEIQNLLRKAELLK